MKYITIAAAALALAGCDKPENVETQVKTFSGTVRTVVVKGHEYIVFEGPYKGNIIHSESCKCKGSGK